jgi:hypothetical protein
MTKMVLFVIMQIVWEVRVAIKKWTSANRHGRAQPALAENHNGLRNASLHGMA